MADLEPVLSGEDAAGKARDYASTYGSLFSGIGGLDLGLDQAGWECAWQSEINPYACSVLARHWPHVPNLGDITKIDWKDVERVDLIAGGFPCQDLSTAHTANGGGVGLRGQKSGLWRYFLAAVDALRPASVLIENIARWRYWVPEVRADLSDLGYASLPVVLHAGSFGAPHRRARCFVVAHADGQSEPARSIYEEVGRMQAVPVRSGYWGLSEPSHLRVDDGPPDRMDRLRACGNAVVPQVARWIGTRLMPDEATRDERDLVTSKPGPSARYDALEIDGGADTSDGSSGRGTAAPPSPGDDHG